MPSRPAVHQRFMRILLACGANPDRLSDASSHSVERFADYLTAHPPVLTDPAPLVVLTKSRPISVYIFRMRRVLEARVPRLRGAAWVIFYDPDDDPSFAAESTRHGPLSGALDAAPIWTTDGDGDFLIVTPNAFRENLGERVESLAFGMKATWPPGAADEDLE